MNCTPKVRFFLSNFWGAVQFQSFFDDKEKRVSFNRTL